MDKKRKRLIKGIAWAVLLTISIFGFWKFYGEFKLNPFSQVSFENTSAVTLGNDKSIYLVGSSNRKVSKINHENKLIYQLIGGKRETEGYYLANEIAVDNQGQLFMLGSRWDESGAFIETETIRIYNASGQYVDTLYRYQDESQSHLTPVVKGLSYSENRLNWFVLETDGIQVYQSDSKEPIANVPYENAMIMVQDIKRLNDHQIIYMTKTGFIYQYNQDTQKTDVLYEPTEETKRLHSNIWRLVIDENQKIYVNDLGRFGIFKLDKGQLQLVFNSKSYTDGKDQVYFNFFVNEGSLIAVNDQTVVLREADQSVRVIDAVTPSLQIMAYRLLAWLFLILSLVSLGMLIHLGMTWLIKKIAFSGVGRTVPILLAVAIAAFLITMVAIDSYGKVIDSQALNSLKLVVQNSKYVVDGDLVSAIKSPTDFYNEDYQQVSDELQKLINYNQETWNENLYTALYTIVDGRYYALMYNDNQVTPYYPFNAFTDEPKYDFFKNAFAGEITNGTEVDADGQWIFSMGPVYDKAGNIVAIIEVGMNKYIFDEWNQKVVNQIVIDIVSMIIILILLVSEISFFSNWVSERRQAASKPVLDKKDAFNELNIIRPLGLLTYVIIFMCTAFIPVMAKSIYQPLGNIPMTVALGLPIVFEVLFTAITILFAGVLAEKKGWRVIFYSGALILIASAIATGFTRSLLAFIIIRSIAGIGNGFIQMTMYAFINVGDNIAQRNEAFAHMMSGAIAGTNLGIVLGANLADKIGYFNVFFVMAGFGVLAIAFERSFLRHYETMASDFEETEDEGEVAVGRDGVAIEHVAREEMSWIKFFTRKDVIVFFTLILVPAFLCYMYLEYFFPIFAESQGLTTSVVGVVFSLYGLFIVYFGPSISTFSERYLGAKNATALASLLTGVSLLVFAVSGSLSGAIFAVLVLALSDSFGETVYTTYFLALKASRKVGKSIAAGYLEFVSQIGKMLGALAFGIAIGFGEQLGIGVIGLITLSMSFIFYFASLRRFSR